MLRGMLRLTTKADVLRVVITVLVSLALWGVVIALVQSPGGRIAGHIVVGTIVVGVVYGTAHSLRAQASQLLEGRCPHPLCHGTVHHSESVPKGFLVCPTCRNRWPEIEGIKFRATGRDRA